MPRVREATLLLGAIGSKYTQEDYTDREAMAAILLITRGNIRLIERLHLERDNAPNDTY
jgi:hypothetical protein